jgi:hypothetical protein
MVPPSVPPYSDPLESATGTHGSTRGKRPDHLGP